MAGIERGTPSGEAKPQQHKPTEQHKLPPEKSALSRAVERTRELYERNGWVFLPFGEGRSSPSLSNLQGKHSPEVEDSNGTEFTGEEIRKANEGFFKELGILLDSPPLSEEFHQRVRERFRRLPQESKPE